VGWAEVQKSFTNNKLFSSSNINTNMVPSTVFLMVLGIHVTGTLILSDPQAYTICCALYTAKNTTKTINIMFTSQILDGAIHQKSS
jgi:hypothetical protein